MLKERKKEFFFGASSQKEKLSSGMLFAGLNKSREMVSDGEVFFVVRKEVSDIFMK